MKNLGKLITDSRKEKGWTHTNPAKENNLSREIFGKDERGEAVPSIAFGKRVADVFAVPLDCLFTPRRERDFDKNTLKRRQVIEQLQHKNGDCVPPCSMPFCVTQKRNRSMRNTQHPELPDLNDFI